VPPPRSYADALVEIEHCLKRKKPDVETYQLASLICAKLGNNERAVALCEEGLSKHPDSALLLADMIIPLAQGGQRQRADEIYTRLRETTPTLAEVPFSMGVVHMHAEELDTAVKLLEEAISLRAEYPEAYYCLGVIQNRKGEYQNALSYFKLAVELKPDYAEAYYNMKDSYDGLRDFEKSIAMLDKAVHLNPAYR
jgi:tetratricopeptide (TPR) repeat protein